MLCFSACMRFWCSCRNWMCCIMRRIAHWCATGSCVTKFAKFWTRFSAIGSSATWHHNIITKKTRNLSLCSGILLNTHWKSEWIARKRQWEWLVREFRASISLRRLQCFRVTATTNRTRPHHLSLKNIKAVQLLRCIDKKLEHFTTAKLTLHQNADSGTDIDPRRTIDAEQI